MTLLKMFRNLIGKAPDPRTEEMRCIVIMQRTAHRFNEEELRDAGERAWGKSFDGKEDPMYFVSVDHPALTVVKAGPHTVRITCAPRRFADDDKYALAHLPQPKQKKAWTEHHACAFLEFFNDLSGESRIPDPAVYASLAKLALELGDPNCTAVYLPMKHLLFPNDGAAEQGLRLLIKQELPFRR